jgi:hypothetical protein
LFAEPLKGADELFAKASKVALDALCPSDDHVVRARNAFERHDFSGERAQATLHSVADDRAADLLGDGEADAHRRIMILAVADEQNKTGRSRAAPSIRGEEIRPLL